MQAILYARFSDSSQGEGDSIARQLRTCTPYIEAKGWELFDTILDQGRSGYHGHHRLAKNGMGTLEREVMDGLHIGRVLVIERLDRFSRENHSDTYDLIRLLTKNGLSIATVEGDRLYAAYEPIEFAAMIELLVRLKMNHEESLKKASHGLAKWEARRAIMVASKKPVTKLCPAWLRLSGDRSRYDIFEGRDQTVRLIFDLADKGLGSLRITKALNERGIKPWPRFEKRTPRAWSRGTIIRILTDISVTGDFQPMKNVSGKRVPEGEPIRAFYPPIVDADIFARVSASATDRKVVRGNKGGVPNLVSGLVFCKDCGAKMQFRTVRAAGYVRIRNGVEQVPTKSASASLLCPRAVEGACSNKRNIAYHSLEKALIDAALHLSLDDGAFERRDEVARLDINIAARQRDHDIAYSAAVTLWENAGSSAIAQTLAMKRETEAQDIKTELEALKAERSKAAGKVSAAEHITRLNAIRETMLSDNDEERISARTKVAQGFRSVIDRIECDANGTSAVSFVEGKRLIFIRAGRGRASPIVSDFDFHRTDRQVATNDTRTLRYIDRLKK